MSFLFVSVFGLAVALSVTFIVVLVAGSVFSVWGLAIILLADSTLCIRTLWLTATRSDVLGLLVAEVCVWSVGLVAALLRSCALGPSVGVCLGFGGFSWCSPPPPSLSSALDERERDGILVIFRTVIVSSLSPGDVTAVVREVVDFLLVSMVTVPLTPLAFPLLLFCERTPPLFSFLVSVATRGLPGDDRLRLKIGSAPQLALGSVLPRASTNPAPSEARQSDWARPTSFLRLELSGEVSMVTD